MFVARRPKGHLGISWPESDLCVEIWKFVPSGVETLHSLWAPFSVIRFISPKSSAKPSQDLQCKSCCVGRVCIYLWRSAAAHVRWFLALRLLVLCKSLCSVLYRIELIKSFVQSRNA